MLFHDGKERLRKRLEIWTGGVDGPPDPELVEAPAQVRSKALPVLSADSSGHAPHPSLAGIGLAAAQPSFEPE